MYILKYNDRQKVEIYETKQSLADIAFSHGFRQAYGYQDYRP